VCFYLDAAVRGRGLPERLLDEAVRYAFASGARTVEAYPWPGGASYFYKGSPAWYQAAGFTDIAVPHGRRPVMRRTRQSRNE
jgi:ribosomal protein S18 acetylase RimI-like enzyme